MKVDRTRRACVIIPRHGDVVLALLVSLLLLTVTSSFAESPEADVDIPSQEVGKALETFAEQTGTSLMFSSDAVGKIPSKSVSGRYTQDQALRILLEDTGLIFKRTSQNTFSVQKAPKKLDLQSRHDLSETDMWIESRRDATWVGRQPVFIAQADAGKPNYSSRAIVVAGKGAEGTKVEVRQVFTLKEIIVTATKREESILEVPLSMTAFNDRKIEALGITNPNDIEQLTPGLQFGDSNEQVGQGTVIRGIGSNAHAQTHNDLAVATYVDGVYTDSAYGVSPNLYDVDRVEIARGPQGTLHGRNSIAGSISYFNKRPTAEWDADILAEFTDQFTQRYNVAFGGPILDRLAFRITGGYFEGEGAQENIGTAGDYDAPDQLSFAPQLRFKTNRFDINLRYSWTEDKGSPRTQVVLREFDRESRWLIINGKDTGWNNGALLYPEDEIVPSVIDCDWGVQGSPIPTGSLPPNRCGALKNVVNLNVPGIHDSYREEITFNADYSIGAALTLRYTLGSSNVRTHTSRDHDGMNRDYGGYNGDPLLVDEGLPLFNRRWNFVSTLGQYSHEFQVISDFDGPINFIAGAYYYANKSRHELALDNYATDYRFLNAQSQFAAANADLTAMFLNPAPSPVFGVNAAQMFGVVPPATGFDTCKDVGDATYAVLVAFDLGDQYTPLDCTEGSDNTFMRNDVTEAEAETKAVFAHLDYQVNDRLLVSGGLRYTKDNKVQGDTSGFQILNANEIYKVVGPWFNAPTLAAHIPMIYRWHDFEARGTDTWDAYIGNISAEYMPFGNTMVYGRIATGYRAGAFNYTDPFFQPPKVDEETLVNYEVGIKGLSMDQRLMFTGSAFYSTYDGFQINAGQVIPGGFGGPETIRKYTTNVDGTTLWGLELEGSYFPMESLQVSGYYAYLDSKAGPFASVASLDPNQQYGTWPIGCVPGVDPVCSEYSLPTEMTGNQLPMQPNHKWALTASYTMPMPNLSESKVPLGVLQFLSTYSYTGERHPEIANTPSHKMRGYGRWDIRAYWRSDSGKWSAGVFVQNILDDIGLIEYLPVNPNTNASPPLGTLTDHRRAGAYLRWGL